MVDSSVLAQVIAAAPCVDPGFVAEHLDRIGVRYAIQFDAAQIGAHVHGLAALTAEAPVVVHVEQLDGTELGEQISCTILGYDAAGTLALIAGVLAASGFSLRRGVAFSYRPASAAETVPRAQRSNRRRARTNRWPRPRDDGVGRDRLVDQFVGVLDTRDGSSHEAWRSQVESQFGEVFRADRGPRRRLGRGAAHGQRAGRRGHPSRSA